MSWAVSRNRQVVSRVARISTIPHARDSMSTVVTPDERVVPEVSLVPAATPVRERGRLAQHVRCVGLAGEWCLGAATLWLGLAVLASIPLGQFLALGYLLEASGRVA